VDHVIEIRLMAIQLFDCCRTLEIFGPGL